MPPNRAILLHFVALVILIVTGVTVPSHAEETDVTRKSRYPGEVVFIRGGFDVFSRGLDEMAAKLKRRGIRSQVLQHSQAAAIAKNIIANQKRFGRKPVLLIGHSWGANAAISIAQTLKKKGIRVDYLASFAATNPGLVPSNVRKVVGYFFQKDGWGKPLKRAGGKRSRLTNIDLSKKTGVNHFNIEKNARLQRQVIRNVLRLMRRNRRA